MLICEGLCIYFLANSCIFLGMVAENKSVFFSELVAERMVSIGSINPMFSISSASSNTRVEMLVRSRVFLCKWSMILPGVPTTMCTPFLSFLI